MEQLDLLRHVAHVLEDMRLRYFVTGSTATIFYGEPRFTNDIDLVVDLPESRVAEFCRQFPQDDFYLSEEAARDAVKTKSQFNVIHPASGLKLDVIIPGSDAFNESRFARAHRLHAADDFSPYFASPEDAIIKKMQYYREGGSEKHLRDIAGVLKISRDRIDEAYIARWAAHFGLADLWSMIQAKARRD
jgi:hypothetical protein